MASPFTIDIRPRRLPVEIKQIEEASKEHGNTLFQFLINFVVNSSVV